MRSAADFAAPSDGAAATGPGCARMFAPERRMRNKRVPAAVPVSSRDALAAGVGELRKKGSEGVGLCWISWNAMTVAHQQKDGNHLWPEADHAADKYKSPGRMFPTNGIAGRRWRAFDHQSREREMISGRNLPATAEENFAKRDAKYSQASASRARIDWSGLARN